MGDEYKQRMKVSENKKFRVEFMARLSREELDQYTVQLLKPYVYRFKCAIKIASMRIERFGKTAREFEKLLKKNSLTL